MIFKRRHITPFFLGALADLGLVLICIVLSIRNEGNSGFLMGLFNIALMALSLVFSVLGLLELSYWKEEKRRLGIWGTRIYIFVFLVLAALYGLGAWFG